MPQDITRKKLAGMIDHAVLPPAARADDLNAACDLARRYGVKTLCVKPCDVLPAVEALADSPVAVSTVVGFPHGGHLAATKAAEAAAAVADGAMELDMVANLGALRDGDFDAVRADIAAVVHAADGRCVKVILECCLLDEAAKRLACRAARQAGAQFVKTSTGFAAAGATVEDVRLLRAAVGSDMGVKAAGGIRTLADALAMIDAGANRLGVSATAIILDALD